MRRLLSLVKNKEEVLFYIMDGKYFVQIYEFHTEFHIEHTDKTILCRVHIDEEKSKVYIYFIDKERPSDFGHPGHIIELDSKIEDVARLTHPDAEEVAMVFGELVKNK